MDKLKVIQIGIGHDHGTSGFNSILRQTDVFDVVGFAVPDEELISGKWETQISEYRDQRKIPYFSLCKKFYPQNTCILRSISI